jgi:predicted acyltransferase (DUF342 family)
VIIAIGQNVRFWANIITGGSSRIIKNKRVPEKCECQKLYLQEQTAVEKKIGGKSKWILQKNIMMQ